MYTRYCKNIVVLILTLGSAGLYGQVPVIVQPLGKQASELKKSATDSATIRGYISTSRPFSTTAFYNLSMYSGTRRQALQPRMLLQKDLPIAIQKDLYVKGFGFFCKKEMQLEKTVKLPLRFRLGSLEQCNILEQKY